jgi:hypothetical protein
MFFYYLLKPRDWGEKTLDLSKGVKVSLGGTLPNSFLSTKIFNLNPKQEGYGIDGTRS